ncbi:MAG: hypothetical protein AAF581_00055 [Planctomycetota bacterium]
MRQHQQQLEEQQAERERVAEARHRELQRLLAEKDELAKKSRSRGVPQRLLAENVPPTPLPTAVVEAPLPMATPELLPLGTSHSQPSPYPSCPSCAEKSWNGLCCLACGHTNDDLTLTNSFGRSLLQLRAARRASA